MESKTFFKASVTLLLIPAAAVAIQELFIEETFGFPTGDYTQFVTNIILKGTPFLRQVF